MENTILVKDVLWILASILAVATFVVFITNPYKKLKDMIVEENLKLLKQQEAVEQLSREIKTQQHLINSSLRVQLLLMQHIIYGNHEESLKQELSNFQNSIIDTN